ncbi:MAG: glycoside hydrolase family 57 protein [Cyanobacteria bacterium P01_H01_bin.74]
MQTGAFVLMLHSHLPFYRKAGMWPFGEENLYDCMVETYIPLLNALNDLREEGILAKITVGITPILCEQLADPYLQDGFIQFIDSRLEKIAADVASYPNPEVAHSEHLAYLSDYYHRFYSKIRSDFTDKYHKNLVQAFKILQDQGAVEITTSAATHGFLPLLATDEAIEAQLKAGIESYKFHFGRMPKGIWLPECAYRPTQVATDIETKAQVLRPAIESFLFNLGIKHFYTEFHAIEGSEAVDTRRDFGIYRNIEYIPLEAREKTGLTTYEAYWMKNYPVAVMGRNNRASFQVWSAAHGYPGDGLYREFHRRDQQSGMKYWRLTSKDADLGEKMLYDPVQAVAQTKGHANHFTNLVHEILDERFKATGKPGLIMVSFDTELYGHWWFEGVEWLKHVIRNFHHSKYVATQTSTEYLNATPPSAAIELPECTWGQGGHYWVWKNNHTEWMWPIIHAKELAMRQLVQQFKDETDKLKIRALNQALRELLLLQSSDWPFLVTTFQAKDYAVERFEDHVKRFDQLQAMLQENSLDQELLAHIESIDNPFTTIDYRWYHYDHQPDLPELPLSTMKSLSPSP